VHVHVVDLHMQSFSKHKPSDVVPLAAHQQRLRSTNISKQAPLYTSTTMRAACFLQVSRGLWASTAPKPCSLLSPPLSHGPC
jgi:hypothetical protein